MTLTVHQSHDRIAVLGHPVYIDGDPWVITDIKPQRESGVILGPIVGEPWGYSVEPRIVVVTIERYQEKAA